MKSIPATYKKIQGLSLIEMMVSMVLGLFLIGGLTSMYLGSKKTDRLRSEISHMEENARIALSSLRLAIQHTGYKSVDNFQLDKPFQTPIDGAIQNKFCRDGESMIINSALVTPPAEFAGYTRDGVLGDRITVVYRADNPDKGPVFFDCSGNAYASNQARQVACSTDTTFETANGMPDAMDSKIYNGLYVNRADKTLRCYGSRSTTGSLVLADNIENLQIRYGVTNGNNTSYKNATDVETSKEWETVTSIQAAILVGSYNEVLEHAESQQFQLLDQSVTRSGDRKLYRVYSTTINLPNRSRREMSDTSTGEAGEAARR